MRKTTNLNLFLPKMRSVKYGKLPLRSESIGPANKLPSVIVFTKMTNKYKYEEKCSRTAFRTHGLHRLNVRSSFKFVNDSGMGPEKSFLSMMCNNRRTLTC